MKANSPALVMERSASAASSLFINCPFDDPFEPLFDAIFLSVVACGFTPRSALESGVQADARIERILRALNGSRYSIHDLSRSTGEGVGNLARFNMPLELGMAMQLRYAQRDESFPHEWFVTTSNNDVDRAASDLKPFDISPHGATDEGMVGVVIEWLQAKPEALATGTKSRILQALPRYRTEKKKIRAERGLQWWRFVDAAATIAAEFQA